MQAGRVLEPMVSRPAARRGTLQRYRWPVKRRSSRNGSDPKALHTQRQDAHPETAVSGSAGTGTSERMVRLRVICKAPPDPDQHGAIFGLQDNSTASHWDLHAGTRKSNGDFVFGCEVRVRPNARNTRPNFLGNFVHGKPDERFLYLSWRPRDWRPGQPEPPSSCWQRRMKIHLSTITWDQIEEATRSEGVLEATVAGTAKDGGPNCASVPLLGEGWTVRKL